MSTKKVKFTVELNVDGKQVITQASAEWKELERAIGKTSRGARGLSASMRGWMEASVIANNVRQAIGAISGQVRMLTDAYRVQLEAETKLTTVMRQRMGASERDIQAIKDMASAQQELGVIGDEVTLMGMQQLGTFVSHRETLEKLMPSMLNLIAQQKGFNATAQDAVGIANLFGKAMQGNVSALTRVGITMSDAQKEALKEGDELQRAALLAEIVTQNVGDMNAQLAQTSAGKAQQVANAFGDWLENLGAMIAPYETVIQQTASIGQAAESFFILGNGVKAAVVSLIGLTNTSKIAALNTKLVNFSVAQLDKAFVRMGLSARVGAGGVKLLTWSIRALEVALGVGALIAAASVAMEALGFAASKTADEIPGVTDAIQQARASGEEWLATAEAQCTRLKSLMDAHQDTADMVVELNRQYGDIFGSYKTAAQWYDVLTQKSRIYAQQLIAEAEAKAIAADIADKRLELRKAQRSFIEGVRSGAYLVNLSSSSIPQISIDGRTGAEGYSPSRYNPFGPHAGVPYRREVMLNKAGEVAKAVIDGLTESITSSEREMQRVLEDAAKTRREIGAPLSNTALPSTRPSGGGRSSHSSHSGGDSKTAGSNTAASDYTWEEIVQAALSEAERKVIEAARLRNESLQNASKIIADAGEDEEAIRVAEERAAEIRDAAEEAYSTAYESAMEGVPALRQTLDYIGQIREEMQRPSEFKTIDDFDKELAYLNSLLSKASAETLPAIYEQMRNIQKERDNFSLLLRPVQELDADSTLSELDEAESILSDRVRLGSEKIRAAAQEQLRAIRRYRAILETESLTGANVYGETPLSGVGMSLEKLDALISFYSDEQKNGDVANVLGLQKRIKTLTERRNLITIATTVPEMQGTLDELNKLSGRELKLKVSAIGLDTIKSNIADLTKLLGDAASGLSDEQKEWVQKMIAEWTKYAGTLDKAGKSKTAMDGISSAASSVDNLATSFARLNTESKGLASSMAAVSLAASLSQLVASMVRKVSEGTVSIWDWIAGVAAGTATIVSAATQLKGVGAFAEGGVVSGPTLALVGEYAGATNNPEVIAPLSKLQSMIDSGEGAGGEVRFEIDAYKLVGILDKWNRRKSRR